MKVCVIQNRYSMQKQDIGNCFSELLSMLDNVNSCDILVLSEDSDVPSAIQDKETYDFYVKKNNNLLIQKCKETAIRCNCTVFVNAALVTDNGNINTTYVIYKTGEIIGMYKKAHPAPSEFKTKEQGGLGFNCDYANTYSPPYTITIDGIKYAFLTCYDFYFQDNFTNIARQKPDIIIGCSLQRTDKHSALETMCKNVAYTTNTYLVRASVSLEKDSETCGVSCVVAPDGTMLLNMNNDVGIAYTTIDPSKKHLKAAGFGGKEGISHFEYTEQGRRPWLYSRSGPDVVQDDENMPYPRLCAHRGWSNAMPENTLISLASAVALDADEIEFDLWPTKDGYLVSSHDPTLQRTSNGEGKIYEHTFAEISQLDFGYKYNQAFEGLRIVTFETLLKKLAGKTIMNVHLKTIDDISDVPNEFLDSVVALIDKYQARKYVYLMITNDKLLEYAMNQYPDITRCIGANMYPSMDIDDLVNRAIKYKAKKIQIFIPYYNKLGIKLRDVKEKIDRAHKYGIIVNLFYADTIEDANEALDLGVDCILTNNYLQVFNALKPRLGRKYDN